VKVIEEGKREFFFDDVGEGEDTIVKWKDSEARQLLYKMCFQEKFLWKNKINSDKEK
jgi:hypothetical protein